MPRDPFWLAKPKKEYDMARLKPSTLKVGVRFETVADARRESHRSETVLAKSASTRRHAETLNDCREEFYICQSPYCPGCARCYRRWLFGQILQLYPNDIDGTVVTILLETSMEIMDLNPRDWRRTLRHRIEAAALGDEVIVGGFEMSWRWREQLWVLHAHLVVPNCSRKQYRALSSKTDPVKLSKPVMGQPVRNLIDQVSYTSKFTTYHRPFKQQNGRKPPAKPLNDVQHRHLVAWMSQFEFTEFLFLYGCRRFGANIKVT